MLRYQNIVVSYAEAQRKHIHPRCTSSAQTHIKSSSHLCLHHTIGINCQHRSHLGIPGDNMLQIRYRSSAFDQIHIQNNMYRNEPWPDPHSSAPELDHIVRLARGFRALQKIPRLCTHNISKDSGQGRMDNGMHN